MKFSRAYKTLILSESDSFNGALLSLLNKSTFPGPVISKDISEAKRLLFEKSFDVLIINPPIGQNFCIEFAKEVSGIDHIALLFSVPESNYEDFKATLTPYGIFTLLRPASEKTLKQTLDNLIALRERLRLSEKKVVGVEEKMAEIRLVNHAKWLLIQKKNMSEEEAHKYIEKNSMDNSMKKSEFCEMLIKNIG